MNTFDFSFLTEYKGITLTMILTSFFIGVIIASVAFIYRQQVLGEIVRRITSKGCLSEETALTKKQLGYSEKNIFINIALRKGSTFSKIVLRTSDKEPKFYIPEERKLREEIRFRKEGNNIVGVILAFILFAAAAYVLITVIPWFTDKIINLF